MKFNIDHFLTVTFTLFAVIDILGSTPPLISLKEKMGGIREGRAILISGALMVLFLLAGELFLRILGVDVGSFAVAGSIVIFILGLEMILGHELFKSDNDARSGTVVPIAFPLIAGSRNAYYHHVVKSQLQRSVYLPGHWHQPDHYFYCVEIAWLARKNFR